MRAEVALQRFKWADIAKGIGIILVVVGHVWRGLQSAGMCIPRHLYADVDNYIYAFHMPLFFFAAGLFLFHSAGKSSKEFFSTKARTIAYPYVLWTILFALSQAALAGHTNRDVNLSHVLHTFLWRPYAHFWFLYALLLALVPLFYLAKLPQRSVMIVFAAVTVKLAVVQGMLGTWVPLLEAAHYFLYIAGGAVLSDLIFQWAPRLSSIAWLSIAAIGGYAALAILLRVLPGQSSLHAVTGIGATVALAMLLARTIAGDVFSFLGRKSLVIYVAHVIPAAALRIALQRQLGIHSLALHLILGTAVGIAGPLLLEQIALFCNFPFLFSWPRRQPQPADAPPMPRPTLRAA